VAQEYLDYFARYAAAPHTAHNHGTREVIIRHRNGSSVCMDLTLTPMYLRQPLFIGLLHDITHHKQSEDALQRAAMVDPLTKIANRRHFDSFLEKEWQRAMRSGQPLSLVVLDVDHFKLYNDTLGHPAGDACLQQVAQAIASHALRRPTWRRATAARNSCCCSRKPMATRPAAGRIDPRRIESLQIPHPRSTTSAWLTVSIGVATIHPHQLDNTESLFVAADRAMYVAKEAAAIRCRPPRPAAQRLAAIKAWCCAKTCSG
jgi:diguanylate cyclase (GGDEF)-like protein